MIRQTNTVATLGMACLSLVVCAGPLPFGGVMIRDRTLLGLLVCVAAVAAFFVETSMERVDSTRRPSVLPGWMLAAIGGLGLAQSLPLPQGLVGLLSPRLLDIWEASGGGLADPAEWLPLSIAPGVSRTVALHWLVVGLGFWAASSLGRERRMRRFLAFSLLAVAVFEVIYGGGRMVAASQSIWGVEVPGDPSRLRGTYVNSDHLATLLLIALAVAYGWLWWGLRRSFGPRGFEQRLVALMLPGLAVVVLFAGLAFTGSRAGLLAAVFALLGMAGLLALHYGRWQVGALGVAVTFLSVAGVALFGWRQGFARLLGTSAYEVTWNARLEVYRSALELWEYSPWVGTGLGTFRQAFPLVQPATVDGLWIHAHSDVLELVVTTGLLGWPLLALGLTVVGRRLWRVLHRGERFEDRAAALVAAGASMAIGLHAVVDFGLTLPANSLVLVLVVGAAYGAPSALDHKNVMTPTTEARDHAARHG